MNSELREKYIVDFRKRLAEENTKAEQQAFVQRQLESAKKSVLLKFLSKEARQRLSIVRVGHPELAEQIETALLNAAQCGALKGEISELQLRAILERAMAEKKNFKLIR
ncbi:MAG: DNA-binding protein [Candidatus Nanoarchaeia archaeon]